MELLDYEKIFDTELLCFQKNYLIYKLFLFFKINNIYDYFNKNYADILLELNKKNLSFLHFNNIIENFYYNNIPVHNENKLEETNSSKKESIQLNLKKTIRVSLPIEKFKKLQSCLVKSSKINPKFCRLSKQYNNFLMKKLSTLSSDVDFLSFFSNKDHIDNLFRDSLDSYSITKSLNFYLFYLILNTMVSFHRGKITFENLYRKVKHRIKFSQIKSLDIDFDLYFDIIL